MPDSQIKKIRKEKHIGQKEVADLLSMTQSTYSRREGKNDFTIAELHIIAKGLDVELSALTESSPMIVSEPGVDYMSSAKTDTSSREMCKHFDYALRQWMMKNHISKVKEAADELTVNYSHIVGIKNGERPLTMGIISKLVKKGSMSADFLFTGSGSWSLNESSREIPKLQQRIKELERDKEILQLAVESGHQHQSKKTG
jgi:plasmid maintenance system antidote protein VapI